MFRLFDSPIPQLGADGNWKEQYESDALQTEQYGSNLGKRRTLIFVEEKRIDLSKSTQHVFTWLKTFIQKHRLVNWFGSPRAAICTKLSLIQYPIFIRKYLQF